MVDYLGRGPYSAQPLPQVSFRCTQMGSNGEPVTCTVQVFVPRGVPAGGPGAPLLVLSAGFLLASGLYRSYAEDLASWGLAVALYDIPELLDDAAMVTNLGAIIDTVTSDPRIRPHVDARSGVLLAGHSRGGKLSVLAAASDPRVRGVALLDPVDNTPMTPSGPGYPSALPAMRIACGAPRSLPCLIVGAALNGDVIPADANYKRFITACPGLCWSVDLQGAGHLQFLDMQVGLFAMFSKSGPTPDEAVRRVSKAALVAWALELAVPLARGQTVDGAQVVQRLQQAAGAMSRQASLTSSIKGFDRLGGPASSTVGGDGAAAAATASAASGASYDESTFVSSLFDMLNQARAAQSGSGGMGTRSGTSSGGASSSSSSGSSGGSGGGGSSTWSRSWSGSTTYNAETKWSSDQATTDSSGRQQQQAQQQSEAQGQSQSSPSRASTSNGAGSSGSGGGGGAAQSRSSWSYEQLMGMRARELKAILVERGVDCSDCFEKQDLAKRIMERC